ncbi:MAG TPA: amino acid adenylation domain-containing protein [Ktedonobacteraceae bacterium]|nr:amino acid adenylation domain-containing protein [Ktedonobacteraceae bacterium]
MTDSQNAAERIARLPPEKRALLFQQLAERKASKPRASLATIPRQERTTNAFPLSFAQQRLWFLDQYEQQSSLYNMAELFHIHGTLHVQLFQQALDALVTRHEILRTKFAVIAGEARQVITELCPLAMPIIDMRGQPASERVAKARQIVTTMASEPFNLLQDPLLRVALLRLDEEEYYLLLSMHHSIYDGWSASVLLRDLLELYQALLQGRPPSLPELSIQYADFAVWERTWLQGETLEHLVSYWRDQLAGSPTLDLSTDYPRPAVRTHGGDAQSLYLSSQHGAALKTLSQRENCTLFMTLLAAFTILLSRYTAQDDIAVGTPIAHRNRPETEDLIGLFVNTLVIRTKLAGNPTFRELLGRVRTVCLDAYAHQDLPFEKLVGELAPPRDLSYTPLFQVLCVLQNTPTLPQTSSNLTFQALEIENRTAKFDLSLFISEKEQGLSLTLEYNSSLFEAASIQRMLRHFQVLLGHIITQPEKHIADLPLLAPEERHQLLIERNVTQAIYPEHLCLHQMIEAQAARTPDAIAAALQNQQITYQALNQQANRLARALQGWGVGPDVLVGVCMERSCEMVLALLAILKAGGAYIPLDPTYPRERIGFILQDTRLSIVLTQTAFQNLLPQTGLRTVCLDMKDITMPDAGIEIKPASNVQPENLAYTIYTSGSTGKPKGVQITHQAVTHFLASMRAQPGLTSQDILLAVTSISFDIAGLELFLPLIVGARLQLASRDVARDGEQLAQQLSWSGASIMQATPTTWRLLLAAGWQNETKMRLLCGGEALPPELARQLKAQDATLWNMYGPTETTIWSTAHKVEVPGTSVPLGRPIAHTQIYLLNARLEPVPVGVVGNLYIGGFGLSRGYLNRPDLTAERFIPDPFSTDSVGKRLYQTGDLARYRADGTLEFLGRNDHQVKIHGFRIELQEIEALLEQHPSVRECAVIAREDILDDKRLVAYIVPQTQISGVTTTPAGPTACDKAAVLHHPVLERSNHTQQVVAEVEIREYLKEQLPEYMLPSVIMALPSLPLTPNGKVDRRALPVPDYTLASFKRAYTAPRTQIEKALANIWSQLLGIAQIGIHDGFFELGGDSLLVLRAIARTRQEGWEMTAKQIFQYQTIAELAQRIGSAHTLAEQGLVIGLAPLTPSIHRFIERNLPHPSHYSLAYLLEARERFVPWKVAEVVRYLLLQHDVLRAHLVQENGVPRLLYTDNPDTIPCIVIDISGLTAADQRTIVAEQRVQLQTSFQVNEGPLFKVALFVSGPQKPDQVLLVCHYWVADILSWQILLEDFDTAYEQLEKQQQFHTIPKTTSFKQWAERLVEYAHAPGLVQEHAYWLAAERQTIATLPKDYPAGKNTTGSLATVTTRLSSTETKQLLQIIARTPGIQIDDVLLTALAYTVMDWTHERKLLVRMNGHGREALFDDMDVSRTLGWFSIDFPLFLNLEHADSQKDALTLVRQHLRSIPRNGIGYGVLRYLSHDMSIANQLRELPQPELAFNYWGATPTVFARSRLLGAFGGHHYDPEALRIQTFAIVGLIEDEQLQLTWEYSTNLHRQSTIEYLSHQFVEALHALVRDLASVPKKN